MYIIAIATGIGRYLYTHRITQTNMKYLHEKKYL